MKKILIVDDEPDLIETIALRLNAEGFEVFTAGDGLEGFNKARSQKPDLIILDFMLPKMDGCRACSLIKNDVKTAKIPIIMFTARTQDADKKMGKDAGANAYIAKPFEPEILLAKIKELI